MPCLDRHDVGLDFVERIYFTLYLCLLPAPSVAPGDLFPLENNTLVLRNLPSKWLLGSAIRFERGLYEPKTSPLRLLFAYFGGTVTAITIQAKIVCSPTLSFRIEEDSDLGPLFDAYARYETHEDAVRSMQGLSEHYLASVTNARLVLKLEVEADQEGRLTRRRRTTAASSRTAGSSITSDANQQSGPTSAREGAKAGSSVQRNDDRQSGQHVLLQQKLEDKRLELEAQINLLGKAIRAQVLELDHGLRGRERNKGNNDDDASSTSTSSSSSSSSLSARTRARGAGKKDPIIITSKYAELANNLIAEPMQNTEVVLQAASRAVQELLGPHVILTGPADFKQRLQAARREVTLAQTELEQLEKYAHHAIVQQYRLKLQPPSLEAFLVKGGHAYFLQCLKGRTKPLTVTSAGITVLVPSDGTFLNDLGTWERDCWNLHVIEGMYRIAELSHRKDFLPISNLVDDALKCQKDPLLNVYVIYRRNESEPMVASVLQADVVCRQKIMVHVVDRILFPSASEENFLL